MKQITYFNFITLITTDFKIDLYKEDILKLPKRPELIKQFVRSRANITRIYNGTKEYPYMIGDKRNDVILNNGVELRCKTLKSFTEILKECNLNLRSEQCKISEGNGWYSNGNRYYYKDVYCEI